MFRHWNAGCVELNAACHGVFLQRKVDTLNSASNDTFKVDKLALVFDALILSRVNIVRTLKRRAKPLSD
jgi:hypothetical protein